MWSSAKGKVTGIKLCGRQDTFDYLRWGPVPELNKKTGFLEVKANPAETRGRWMDQAERKKGDDDINLANKNFECYLGQATPVIIVPGPWSPKDIQRKARQLASQIVANCKYNCFSPQNIITSSSWPQR